MQLQNSAEGQATETTQPSNQQPASRLEQQKSVARQAEEIMQEAFGGESQQQPGAIDEDEEPGESPDQTPGGEGDPGPGDGEPGEDTDDDQGEADPGEGESQTPTKLKDLADKLQVEVSELYNLEVPLGNGESMTLGELKDEVLGHDDLTESRNTFEVEQLQARQELAQLATALQMVGQLSPEAQQALTQIQANEAAYENQQRLAMYHARKEWQDRDTFLADRDRIVNHLHKHGLGFMAQGGVKSAPFMLYLDRMAKLEEKVSQSKASRKRLRENTKQQNTGGKVRVPGRARNTAQERFKATGNKSDQLAAIDEVLGNAARVNVIKTGTGGKRARAMTRAEKGR